MCWSEGASVAMVGVGAVATVVTARRGDPAAIPATLAFFTVMEALQALGYLVIDQCGSPANQGITALSYLHIALQPIFINAFAMALVGDGISPRTRKIVYGLSSLASVVILLRLVPFEFAGPCQLGDSLCGTGWCTRSGSWHIAWDIPLNDMWRAIYGDWLGQQLQFPAYLLAVFALPLFYGATRFVVVHALLGPLLARALTNDPNEMPAIWCLFSVGLVLISLSPLVRRMVAPQRELAPG